MAGFPDLTRSDPWITLPEDRMKHDAQFNQLKPVAGFLTGEQAKMFFLQSGLPTHILSKIWQLSDLNADGRMDRKEFSIAMHLIKKTLLGFELPSVLPSSLLMDHPHMGAATGIGIFGAGVSTSYMSAPQAVMPIHGASASSVAGSNSISAVMSSNFANQPRPPVVTSSGDWSIPQGQRLKYKQLFNNTDISHKGYLTGLEAKNILSQSGLVHSILAQIWCLADIDTDGNLSPDEFCVAMYLIDLAKAGQIVPTTLPPDLVPPSYRKMRRPSETISLPVASTLVSNVSGNVVGHVPGPLQMDAFGDLVPGFSLGGVTSTAVQADAVISTPQEAETLKFVTFEDKRKENFEKGQAELERRRAMLREQQQKESEERLAAERAEQEKRERIRQEQEQKKQMEMEKQLEKQRQLEMEREEQRRKAMEQREAARQELERQRQLEWERQRRDQLMSERQREQSLVDRLRLEVGQLKLELESFETKKIELFSRMEQVRQNITEFTSAIDSMKVSRDSKLSDIENFQAEFEEWNMKLVAAQQERLRVNRQVHTPDFSVDENFKMVESNYLSQKNAAEQMNARLEKLEEEKAGILKQITENTSKLNEMKNQMNTLMSEYSLVENVHTAKKVEWERRTGKSSSIPVQNSRLDAFGMETEKSAKADPESVDWFSNFKVFSSTTTTTFDAWGMSSANTTTSTVANGVKQSTNASQNNTDAWASFDVTDPFNPVSQSADSCETTSTANWSTNFFPSSDGNGDTGFFDLGKKSTSLEGLKKYVALYQFDARNPDELSLSPGDIVWVKLDQSKAEPDWMIGQRSGAEGCFPIAYVQLVTTEAFSDIAVQPPATVGTAKNSLQADNLFATGNNTYDLPVREADDKALLYGVNGNQDQLPVMCMLMASAESSFMPVSSSVTLPVPGQVPTKAAAGVEWLQVQALYPWQAKKENHLTFKKGDIITVLDQQDIWWSGELNGKVGWFPKSYVKVISESSATGTKITQPFPDTNNRSQLSIRPPTPPNGAPPVLMASNDAAVERQTPVQQQPEVKVTMNSTNSSSPAVQVEPSSGMEEVCVVAMYAYSSGESGDLNFNQGDVFTVQKMEGDWWTGTFNGKTGIFPAAYIKVMETLTPVKLAGNKRPEIASVIAPYQATGQEQLTLQPGQLIHVRKKSHSGWWEGELQARGIKRRIGWFPANYVKLLGQGSSTTTPDILSSPSIDHPKGNATPNSCSSLSANPPSMEQVVSLYNYQAQREDELSFPKGSTINILNKDDHDWWKGEFSGKVGMFPANYVTPFASKGIPTS